MATATAAAPTREDFAAMLEESFTKGGLQEGSVVMVGHSWGGAVITEAGNHPKVKALVYVAAGAPDSGQSFDDCQYDGIEI